MGTRTSRAMTMTRCVGYMSSIARILVHTAVSHPMPLLPARAPLLQGLHGILEYKTQRKTQYLPHINK